MHILHIYKDYPPVMGGIEHHLRDLAEGLTARGHQVTVLVTSTGRVGTVEHSQPGLTVIRTARAAQAASTPLSLELLWRARSIHADLVHLQFPYPPGDLAALLAAGRPPLVISYQSDIVRQRRLLQLYRPLQALTLRRAGRIIASSPGYIDSSPFLRPLAAKCRVVPLGIDAARFAEADSRRAALRAGLGTGPIALFVGRLRYYKGLHILLDALAQAPGLSLAIAGSGPERERLEAQARAPGIAGRVRFLGDVADSDLPALYHAADLFVLPSHLRAEAFGLVLAEALASGLPCISTELGTGTSFVNQHAETGIVVPPGDPAALAHALRALAASAELRRHYGERARRRVASMFTTEHMLDGIERVYAEVIAE
jgi:glycosyltransferase involved in cell wall biosynthesis